MKNQILVLVMVSLFMLMPFIGMANATEPQTLIVKIDVPISEIKNGTYLYNPDKVSMKNHTGLPVGFMEDRDGSVTGVQMTIQELEKYMHDNHIIANTLKVSEIKSYRVNIDYNLTKFAYSYIKDMAENGKDYEVVLRTWIGEPKVDDYQIHPSWGEKISDNEVLIIFYPDSYAGETEDLMNVTLIYYSQAFMWSNQYAVDSINGKPVSILVYNSTSEEVVEDLHTEVKVHYSLDALLNIPKSTLGMSGYIDFNSKNGTNDFGEKSFTQSLRGEQSSYNSSIPITVMGVYFSADMVYYDLVQEANITVPEVDSVTFIATVEVEPEAQPMVLYYYLAPMIAIGIIFLIFGLYHYNYEVMKGMSVAFGLALLLTALIIYIVPQWQSSWLLIMMPITFTVLFTYIFTWTKFIDTTLHPQFEYWMLKWGDALSLGLLILLIIEMWSGVITNAIPPFWAFTGVI